MISALSQAIFQKDFRNPGLSADYFWGKFKCVLKHSRTLKNDIRHYPKPFSENFSKPPALLHISYLFA